MLKKVLAIGLVCISALSTMAAAPAGYNLAWSDEFDGNAVDTSNWSFETGNGVQGWGNFEAEYYNPGNFEVANGVGSLIAKHESMGGFSYTSCRMHTKGKREFKYGYFEAKLKTPKGNGLWPAFWTLGSDLDVSKWPSCGEIEMYEQRTGPQKYSLGSTPACAGDNCFVTTCHYSSTWGAYAPEYHTNQTNFTACLCDTFHLYAIQWDSLKIQYFLDGTKIWEYADINKTNNFQSFHQPHFFIANIAIGGNYQGNSIDNSIFPQKLSIDYIRVYQKGYVTQTKAKPNTEAKVSAALVNPSKATMKIYDVKGALVADLSAKVHAMRIGANAFTGLSACLKPGAYVASLTDNGNVQSKKFLVSQ